MRETRLIGVLPAGLIRCFPFPRWHGIGVGPEALARCPGQFFEYLEAGIVGGRSLPPGQPFFQQLMPHISPILKNNFGSDPAIPVPLQSANHNFAVSYIGCNRVLRLFPVGLLEFWTIDIFEIDRLTAALVMDRQAIALMDGDDPCAKVRP